MARYRPLTAREEQIARAVVEAALRVHKNLGPGSLEKINEICFCHELSKLGFSTQRQIELPIVYDGVVFKEGLRLDVLVENLVVCELKAVDQVNALWQAQILSHLRLTKRRLGFLINFNVPLIKMGIQRFVL